MQLFEWHSRRLEEVNARLLEAAGSYAELIPAIAAHIQNAGGKRLRPILTLAGAELAGYSGEADVLLAAAVEAIHTATLLHDDVVDESRLRRGMETAHVVWGNKAAVLVGDFLFARSFQFMVQAGSMEALKSLSDAAAVIAEGEVLQLETMHQPDLAYQDYLRVIDGKTAALFASACEVGGIIAGHAEAAIRLRAFGMGLGRAFQMMDDWMDYAVDSATMGKHTGDDFREGKMTLPLIRLLPILPKEKAQWLRELLQPDGMRDEAALASIRELMAQYGVLDQVRGEARAEVAKAKESLAGLALDDVRSQLRDAMVEVADYCVERQY